MIREIIVTGERRKFYTIIYHSGRKSVRFGADRLPETAKKFMKEHKPHEWYNPYFEWTETIYD